MSFVCLDSSENSTTRVKELQKELANHLVQSKFGSRVMHWNLNCQMNGL